MSAVRPIPRVASSQDFMRGGRTAHPSKLRKKKKQPRKKKKATQKRKAAPEPKAAPAPKPEKPRKTVQCDTCSSKQNTCNYFSAENTDEFLSLTAPPLGGPVVFTNCVCETSETNGICGSCAASWIRNLRDFPDVGCRTCEKSFLEKFSPDISRQLLRLFPKEDGTAASAAASATASASAAASATASASAAASASGGGGGGGGIAARTAAAKSGGGGSGGGGGGGGAIARTAASNGAAEDETHHAKKKRCRKETEKQALSEADASIVQHMTHMHRVRNHNSTEWCHCPDKHGAQHVRMKRVATFYLKPVSTSVRVRGPDGKFQSYDHPTVCYHCMDPCKLGAPCACVNPSHRTNPYYRDFSGTARDLSLIRNCHLDEDKVREFFKQLAALPHDGCICPCGQSLHRAADCHEMTCRCGFHVCYFCGFARFIDSPHITLTSHYDDCPQYPCDVKLGYMQRGVTMQYPCKATGPAKCHGMGKDCSDATHRHWRDLYHANRKAAWAAGFVREVRDIPGLGRVAQEELRKYPEFTNYMYI